MKPAFAYYGGKQRIASKIIPIVESIPHTLYIEPFAGGSTILFGKTYREGNNNHYREVINDTLDSLITFYRVGQQQKEELLELVNCTLYSQTDYRKSSEILKNNSEYSDLEIAWAFYVNINMSFANRQFAGWGTGITGRNLAATWYNRKAHLEAALDRIKKIHVSSEDALRCIKRWDAPHSLFYIDPPYPYTKQGHYKGYGIDDWQNLCNLLDNIQGSYVLSGYPHESYPTSVQKIIEIESICSASGEGKTNLKDKSKKAESNTLGNRKRTETLWICDRSENIREDLQFCRNLVV